VVQASSHGSIVPADIRGWLGDGARRDLDRDTVPRREAAYASVIGSRAPQLCGRSEDSSHALQPWNRVQRCMTRPSGSSPNLSSPCFTTGVESTSSRPFVLRVGAQEHHDAGLLANLERILRHDAMPYELPHLG
jgi:hypothetical protein